MTQENKEINPFRKAANELNPSPRNSSWDRLETMLDNQTLVAENKSYKKQIKWFSGIAALILCGAAIAFFYNTNSKIEPNAQFAYQTESLENDIDNNTQLYDIEKLSKLNDAQLWSNIREGGPKPKVRK